jgi:hypothetical protein
MGKPAARDAMPGDTRQKKGRIRKDIQMRKEENVIDAHKPDIPQA